MSELRPAPTPPPAPRAGMRLLKTAVKLALVAAMVYFWYLFVRKSMIGPDGHMVKINWSAVLASPGSVLAACGAFLLGSLLFSALWSLVCREIGGIELSPLLAFRASMIGWIARYVPGNVWSLASKAYCSSAGKTQLAPVTIAITVETVWAQVSGLLLAAIILPWYPSLSVLTARMRLLSLVFLAASFFFAWPPVFSWICNLGLRLLRQPPLPRRPRYAVLLALMAGYMGMFASFSLGFIALARCFGTLPGSAWPLLIGAFTLSWVVGFLTFLAPNGLGVRDTLLAAILAKAAILPVPAIMPLVVICRLLTMAVELFCAAIAIALPLCGLARTPREAVEKDGGL